MVRPTSVAPSPYTIPVPDPFSVPPVTVTPLFSTTADPLPAVIVPPVFVQLDPLRFSVPPLVASIVALLVDAAAPSGLSTSLAPLTLALLVPAQLFRIRCPLPIEIGRA